MPVSEEIEIELLFGTNCTRAIKPEEVIPGGDNDPYGEKQPSAGES